jgi:hypothetical protein
VVEVEVYCIFVDSTHDEPFQYTLDPVADPPDTEVTVAHLVLVPVVIRYCPAVPVAPVESVSLPVRARLVVVALVVTRSVK